MPELGKYAFAVLTSYGGTLILLAGIIALSWVQSRAAKWRLEIAERSNG